jgi:hypothetical protein
MKHIRLFEEYSDEDIRDLMGDFREIGLSDLKFEVSCPPGSFWDSHVLDERDFAEQYRKGSTMISSVKGELRGGINHAKFDLVLSNGDKISLSIPNNEKGELFFEGGGFDKNKNYIEEFNRFYSMDTYIEALMLAYEKVKNTN